MDGLWQWATEHYILFTLIIIIIVDAIFKKREIHTHIHYDQGKDNEQDD